MIGNGKREVGRPTQPVVLGDEATVYQEIPPEQAPETRSHQDTPLHRTKTPYFAGTFIGAFGDNGDSMLPSSSCFTWNPVAANGEFRPAPTSAKLGCADFRSDTQDLHLITHTTPARCTFARYSPCLLTTKALLPSRLQLTTTAVLAPRSTTARHSTTRVRLQSLHDAPPTAAVSTSPLHICTSPRLGT